MTTETQDELALLLAKDFVRIAQDYSHDTAVERIYRRLEVAKGQEPVALSLFHEILRIARDVFGHRSVLFADTGWAKFASHLLESVKREPTVEECFAAGKGPEQTDGFREGGISNTPEERARFEAYMRGHCWDAGEYDTEKQCYDTTMVRMLYGVWRDRGSLCAHPPAPQSEILDSLDWNRLISGESRALKPEHQEWFDKLAALTQASASSQSWSLEIEA